jgi:hypothetical protein
VPDRGPAVAPPERCRDPARCLKPRGSGARPGALAHLALGGVHMLTNRPAEGIAECERALALESKFGLCPP